MGVADNNQSGWIHVANVTVAEAVAFDPDVDDPNTPEAWKTLEAKNYDSDKHGGMAFYCPCCLDKGDEVRLKRPSGEYTQTIPFELIDRQTNEPLLDELTGKPQIEYRRYKMPPRYSLYPGQEHTCDLGDQKAKLSDTIRNNGGSTLNSNAGTYTVNLNIDAGQEPRTRRAFANGQNLGQFNKAANDEMPLKRRIHRSSSSKSGQHSTGIKNIDAIAELLDATQFDQGQRESIILRNGTQSMTLQQVYQRNNVDLYREIYAREKSVFDDPYANHNHTSVFRFRPNGNKKFWNREHDGSMTVQSHPEQIRDNDGNLFYVVAAINFETEHAYDALRDNLEGQKGSCLLYTSPSPRDQRGSRMPSSA